MAKKRRGILRKERIIVEGQEIEVDTFDAEVILGSGDEIESIDELLKQDEAEEAIQHALKEIRIIAEKHVDKKRDVSYYYEVGKILQFVDKKGFVDRKGLIWIRMAHDLRPDLFGGKKKNAQESKRYPETMYFLGKQKERNVTRASFDQWYEILKFKALHEGTDNELLDQILRECETKKLASVQLRTRIKDLVASKSKGK